MHIVLIEFSPSGGLFQFAIQLGEALAADDGSTVRLLTGPEPELSSGNSRFEVLPALSTWHPQRSGESLPPVLRRVRRVLRAGRLALAWTQVLRLLRELQPEAVLFSTWRFPLDAWGVVLVRRLLPCATLGIVAHEPRPLVERGTSGYYKDGGLLNRSLARAWHAMDVAFALGPEARTVIEKTWRPTAEVVQIPHGPESIYAEGDPPPADATGPRILFFGTLSRYKGVETLLDAFALVREQVPEAELVVAGAIGNDLEGTTVSRLEAAPGVVFRPGYVSVPEVRPLVAGARVVALPYLRASQSGVVHLAHALARPVAASAVGDIPSAVTDGTDGWLFPPDDPAALATALLEALRNPATAAARGEAGRLRRAGEWETIAAIVHSTLTAARTP